MGSQVRLVLLAGTSSQDVPIPGMAEVSGKPIVHHWLESLQSCPRLLPVHEKVFILTSNHSHGHYLDWATSSSNGFPAQNIINLGTTACCGEGSQPLQALAAAIDHCNLHGSHIMVASLDHFHGPGFHLQKLVEHAIIRGKDTTTFWLPSPGKDLAEYAQVTFDRQGSSTVTGEYVNPKVASVAASPSGVADGLTTAVLAPIFVFRSSSIPTIITTAAQNALPPGPKQLAQLVQHMIACGTPVYSLQMDMAISVGSYAGVAYAQEFMAYYSKEKSKRTQSGQASEALNMVTQAAMDAGIIHRGDSQVQQLLEGCSEARQLYLKFDAISDLALTRQAEPDSTSAPRATFGPRPVPERFADVSTWHHVARKQHPLYETTAHQIGKRLPNQVDMPDVYAGSTGAFTTTFTGGPYRSMALVTSVTTSKVHKLLDEF